jgi:hypothetical protein
MKPKIRQKRKTIAERLAEKPRVFTDDPNLISEREIRKRNSYSHWEERYQKRQSS